MTKLLTELEQLQKQVKENTDDISKLIEVVDNISKEIQKYGMIIVKMVIDLEMGEIDMKTMKLTLYDNKKSKTEKSSIITLNQ